MKIVTPLLTGVLGGLFAFVASSNAATYNVDFNAANGNSGTYTGNGPTGTGGTWNAFVIGVNSPGLINTVTSSTLVDSAGTPSGITVTLGNFQAYDSNESTAGTGPLTNDFAYQQNLGPGGPASTFSINGLDPTATYSLYLVARNGVGNETATIFSIGGSDKTATNDGTAGFTENVNYVLYAGLTASGGTISGTFNDAKAADNAAFNGFQLVQTPEPASLGLLSLGGLALLARRRRM